MEGRAAYLVELSGAPDLPHQRSRSQVPLGLGLQRPLAEARHRAQLQLPWTPLGADLRRRHEGCLAGGTTPPLPPWLATIYGSRAPRRCKGE